MRVSFSSACSMMKVKWVWEILHWTVASVTAVIAALAGMKSKVLSQVETFGTNTIIVQPHRPDTGPQSHVNWWQIRFTVSP